MIKPVDTSLAVATANSTNRFVKSIASYFELILVKRAARRVARHQNGSDILARLLSLDLSVSPSLSLVGDVDRLFSRSLSKGATGPLRRHVPQCRPKRPERKSRGSRKQVLPCRTS